MRPGLERLRNRIADGVIDRLYVHAPIDSRASTPTYAYQVLLLDEMNKHGVTTVFLNEQTGKTAEDELLVQVRGGDRRVRARRKIVERSRRGRIHLARQGALCVRWGRRRMASRTSRRATVALHATGSCCTRRRSFAMSSTRSFTSRSPSATSRASSTRAISRRGGAPRVGPTVGRFSNPAHMGRAAYGRPRR